MVKKWITDIKEKTKSMSRRQAAGYVATYYWYHILLTLLALAVVIYLIYHIGWGERTKDFSLVMVNQTENFKNPGKDTDLAERFAESAGIDRRRISVDSDYLLSYDDKKLEGINESSYEKFFFNWSAGMIDAMVMPESFYHHCLKQGGMFADLRELLSGEEFERIEGALYEDAGEYRGIYVSGTALSDELTLNEEDPVLLVFPLDIRHEKECRAFVRFLSDGAGK